MHDAHVKSWLLWYMLEGRHFDNCLRHPDFQLLDAPANAQGVLARASTDDFA